MVAVKHWTGVEDAFLIEHYGGKTATNIGNSLGRSVHAVQMRAFRLGVEAVDRSGVKTEWTDEMVAYLKANYDKMITEKLAENLNVSYTVCRDKMRVLKLKKCNHTFWTEEQSVYLIQHFQTIGDVELAEIFNEKFPKSYPWTQRQMNKRRVYLKLNRTRVEIRGIMVRNIEAGRFAECANKRWITTADAYPEGQIVVRHQNGFKFKVIKIDGKFVNHARYVWSLAFGEIPKGGIISHISDDYLDNSIENLQMISRKDGMSANSAAYNLTDNYVASCLSGHKKNGLREILLKDKELIELQRTIYQSNRLCKQLKK
jgi:hypothetical protein